MTTTRHLDEEQLSSLVDDRIDPSQRVNAGEHLASCGRCSEQLASLRATVGMLRGLPELEAPRSFALVETTRRPLALRVAPLARTGGAVAAALFVVLVSVDLLSALGGQQAAPRAAEPANKPAAAAAPVPNEAEGPSLAAPAAAPAGASARERAPQPAAAAAGVAQDSSQAPAGPPTPAAPAAPGVPAQSSRALKSLPEAIQAPPTGGVGAESSAGASGQVSGPRSGESLAGGSSLRPWQLTAGLVAAVLLLFSVLMGRLDRRSGQP